MAEVKLLKSEEQKLTHLFFLRKLRYEREREREDLLDKLKEIEKELQVVKTMLEPYERIVCPDCYGTGKKDTSEYNEVSYETCKRCGGRGLAYEETLKSVSRKGKKL